MVDLLHSTAASSWTNSAAPAAATLANVTAGYSRLDGHFRFVAVAGAATDYALFAYQVPAGYTLRIRGIVISAENSVATVATTPTLMRWSIGANLTAVSLATAGGQRIGVGSHSLAVGAVAGTAASEVSAYFDCPIVVTEGKYAHVILRMPVATATATQEIVGNVTIIAEYT